jgi:membrane-associated phospholipid phosphatase
MSKDRLAAAVIACLVAGCGTLADGRRWGDVTWWPGLEHVKECAVRAACEPTTWVPAAGAVVFAFGDLDEEVVEWAADERPLFGSAENAQDINHAFVRTLNYANYGTALVTPSGDRPVGWTIAKAQGIGIEWGIRQVVLGTTIALKEATGRTRPDAGDDLSFPSGDASRTFAQAALTARNLDAIPLSPWTRGLGKVSAYGMASTVAWARVELERHFPSDVLAGAALGNFLALFLHDVFLGPNPDSDVELSVTPAEDGALLGVSWSF